MTGSVDRRQAMAGVVALSLSAGGAKAAPADGFEEHDALGLAELVRKKKTSPQELLDAAIARTEALNPQFNFLAQRHYDFARKAIADGLPDGPFRGVPWLLKDLHTELAGELTEGGSRLFRGFRAQETSEIARRAQKAGFVIFGKTTTPEFGLTATTENKLTGATRNPWNPTHIAGGSSGGAAAAVASGVLPAAHATDGGGSIRIPASCCGLFGMKPSRGRIPMGPKRTEGWGGMSVHHALTRTVRDSAAIMDCTAGLEPGSRYGAPTPERTFLSEVARPPGRLRIALMTSPFSGTPVDPECVEAARAAGRLCESLGHHVEEAAPVFNTAALGMAAFAITSSWVEAEIEARCKEAGLVAGPDTLEPITLGFLGYGRTVKGVDYARADGILQEAAVRMSRFLQSFDVILSPTLAAPPLELGRINLSPDCDFAEWGARASRFTPFTQIANLTGQPAMSVPLSVSASGLPLGVMFTGRYAEEALLFRLAGQLEMAAPWARRRPKI